MAGRDASNIKRWLVRTVKSIILMIVLGITVPCFAADITPALIETFGNEGGKQCLKSDPGNQYPDGTWGCTVFGMSPRSYPNMPKNPSIEYVAKVYERDFWKPLHLDKVQSQIVANAIFDAAINQGGPTWQKKMVEGLQECINLATTAQNDVLVVDGAFGPKTIERLNKVDQVDLYVNLIGLQYERYRQIVKKNPKMKTWYRGWMYRVAKTVTKAVHDREHRQ